MSSMFSARRVAIIARAAICCLAASAGALAAGPPIPTPQTRDGSVQPKTEPLAAVEAAALDEPQLRLLGTIMGPGGGIAICLNRADSKVFSLRSGQSFEGWTLRSVHEHQAIFEKGPLRIALALSSPADPSHPAPTQAQPTRAAPPPIATLPASRIVPVNPQASGTWRDGDGQMIDPPKPR